MLLYILQEGIQSLQVLTFQKPWEHISHLVPLPLLTFRRNPKDLLSYAMGKLGQ